MPRYDDEDDDRPRRKPSRDYGDEDDGDDEIAAEATPGNGMAVTSLILGIVGFCVPAICGLLAILFGFLGLGKSKETGTGKGMAVTGIILGVINGIIVPIVLGILIYRGVLWTGKKIDQAEQDLKDWGQKMEEENKARAKKEQDMSSQVNAAREQIRVLELACKAYTIRYGGTPPRELRELVEPTDDGNRPLITGGKAALIDPWGKPYQYDSTNTTPAGDPDPLVTTYHPETNQWIYATGRKK